MPAIKYTRLVIEYSPVKTDTNHVGPTVGMKIDEMIAIAMEKDEVIQDIGLTFESAEDFYSFRHFYDGNQKGRRRYARAVQEAEAVEAQE